MRRNQKSTVPAIVMLGDNGVGKTTIVNALLNRQIEDSATTGINRMSKEVIIGDTNITVIDSIGELTSNKLTEEIKSHQNILTLYVINRKITDYLAYYRKWATMLNINVGSHHIRRFMVINGNSAVNFDTDQLNSIKDELDFEYAFFVDPSRAEGIQELRSGIIDAVGKLEQLDQEFGSMAVIVKEMVEKICRLLAKNPAVLKDIEWRDLERTIAGALKELGFKVELTPSAKDGGKDIIAHCIVKNEEKKYYVEIKHWVNGDRPGLKLVNQFVEVNASDITNGGLFISSSGYANPVYRRIGELSRQNVKLGNETKILSLCQQYVMRKDGVWHRYTALPELLFEDTLT